jgi:hypothetical protein
MVEFQRHVFVFVGSKTLAAEDGEYDLAQGLVAYAKQIQGWGLESTMSLPLTTKVKIDTLPDPT